VEAQLAEYEREANEYRDWRTRIVRIALAKDIRLEYVRQEIELFDGELDLRLGAAKRDAWRWHHGETAALPPLFFGHPFMLDAAARLAQAVLDQEERD